MATEARDGLGYIIQAIDNMIEPKVDSLKYDKTYRAKVTEVIDTGMYKVQINGVEYQLPYNGTLSVGEIVRVKSPLNNFSDIYIEPLPGSGGGGEGGTTDYNELTNKPVLNTTSSTSLQTNANEILRGTVSLHKISKTGSYNDLNDKPAMNFIPLSQKGVANGVAILDNNGMVPKSELPSDIVYDSNYIHTDNNFTNAQVQKLAGIEEGAQVNVIEKVQKNGVDLPIVDKTVNVIVPTKTSDLENDTGFITSTVNNLTNYYLKTETYTKTEVNDLIGQISTISIEIVDTLPAEGKSNIIYLVPIQGKKNNVYEEYLWINNDWELIGSTQVDLTGYATETWVNTQIANFLTQTEIEQLINNSLLTYYTKTEINNLLNGKADTTDIPTKVSQLQNDSGYITSADLPTKTSDLINDSGFITNTVNNLTNYYNKTETNTLLNNKADKTDIPTKTSNLINDGSDGINPFLSSIPIASATELGGIKVGANLTISEDGTLSANASTINVIDNLTSTSTEDALSANQGRILNSAISTNGAMIETLQQDIIDIEDMLPKKLEATNIIAGDNITITQTENNITISSEGGGSEEVQISNDEPTQDSIELWVDLDDEGEEEHLVTKSDIPIGSILEFSSEKIPNGWMICDGREVSRTEYADLFDVIGTAYGEGDGSTTFNIPNRKGKFGVGLDSSDADFDVLGEIGGEKSHQLTIDEMPPMNVNMSKESWQNRTGFESGGADNRFTVAGGAQQGNITNVIGTVNGGNQAHNNLPPYIVSYYIIKYMNVSTLSPNANVVDNLTSTSTIDALSANQGNILNENKVDKDKFYLFTFTTPANGVSTVIPYPLGFNSNNFIVIGYQMYHSNVNIRLDMHEWMDFYKEETGFRCTITNSNGANRRVELMLMKIL